MSETNKPDHFEGKEALGHVVERQARGIVESAEIHGMELAGHQAAAVDAAKDTAVVLLLVWLLCSHLGLNSYDTFLGFCVIGLTWSLWKFARAARLGWARLERLHRIVEEERWEIEHHRQQEREELRELYQAKGFDGPLLDQVVDVLMADGDRLLRVMLEEELGLSLACHEHPLKHGVGAFIGAFLSFFACAVSYFYVPEYGIPVMVFVILSVISAVAAKMEKNEVIPAIVWNVGIGAITYGTGLFLLDFILNSAN